VIVLGVLHNQCVMVTVDPAWLVVLVNVVKTEVLLLAEELASCNGFTANTWLVPVVTSASVAIRIAPIAALVDVGSIVVGTLFVVTSITFIVSPALSL
jgi:hypothetical protein